MTERLAEIQRLVAESRQRLDDLARRIGRVRDELARARKDSPKGQQTGPDAGGGAGAEGSGSLDDVELNFVLDYEDPEQHG